MNLQLRYSIAWRMIVPIPVTVIATIAAAWLLVPRMIADNATGQAILASRNMAAQVIAIRKYYTDNVVDKVVREGTFRASPDHKDDARAIPLPATMTHDLNALLSRQGTSSITDRDRVLQIRSEISGWSGVRIFSGGFRNWHPAGKHRSHL